MKTFDRIRSAAARSICVGYGKTGVVATPDGIWRDRVVRGKGVACVSRRAPELRLRRLEGLQAEHAAMFGAPCGAFRQARAPARRGSRLAGERDHGGGPALALRAYLLSRVPRARTFETHPERDLPGTTRAPSGGGR